MSRPSRNKKLINLTSSSSSGSSRRSNNKTSRKSGGGGAAAVAATAATPTIHNRAYDSYGSSSGSEDGDSIRNNVAGADKPPEALDAPPKKSPVSAHSDDGDAAATLVETDPDLARVLACGVNEVPANAKMVRVCALNSNECECVLILDVETATNTRRKTLKLTDDLVRRLRDKGVKLYEGRSSQEASKGPQSDGPPASQKRGARNEPAADGKKHKRDEETTPRTIATKVSALAKNEPASAAEQRTRVLQQFLREYSRMGARKADQPDQRPKMVQLKQNCSMAITDTSVELGEQRSGRTRWNDFSILRNIGGVNLLLNDDSVTGVPNSTTDASVTDGNNDEANSGNSSDDNDSKTKKRNRCALCRKKVGLTGFECRCGGLYCGIHRYSDKHNCTFDYRQLGAQEIRRNNPVVIGEKIQKI